MEGRLNPRYSSVAHVKVNGIPGGEWVLKDISVTGCCVKTTGTVDIHPNDQYHLKIKPERGAHIGSFELQADCKWVRNNGQSTEMGFSIIASPEGRQFQHYVDYLSYHHSH